MVLGHFQYRDSLLAWQGITVLVPGVSWVVWICFFHLSHTFSISPVIWEAVRYIGK